MKIQYLPGAWTTAVMKSSREGPVTLDTGEVKKSWEGASWQRFMEEHNPFKNKPVGSNSCGAMAWEFAMQAVKCPRNVTVGRRQNKLGVWLQVLEYGIDKGKPAWDGGDTSRKRMGQLMKSEIEVQREQWHKEHYNCPVPLDLQDEKKGKDKKVSPEEVRRVLEENSKRKKDDQPYGRRGRKQDLSDVLSKKVNPNLLNGVELRAYEKKYKEIQQDDIKHLARCGYLPVAACIDKWVKSKFDIVTPPELCSGPIQDI